MQFLEEPPTYPALPPHPHNLFGKILTHPIPFDWYVNGGPKCDGITEV